jgi:hypothetical protein
MPGSTENPGGNPAEDAGAEGEEWENHGSSPFGEPEEDEPITPEERVAEMLAGLPAGAQVGVYRTSPEWATGHLQTIVIQRGESIDLARVDQIGRYWGGGTFRFRPMIGGRFAGGSRSLQIDGPPLYRGAPHPNDPHAMPQRGPVLDVPAREHQPALPVPYHGNAGEYAVRELGGFAGALMSRLDALEQAVRGPQHNPVDPSQTVLNALRLAKEAAGFFQNPDALDDDDDEEEEEEPEPASMESILYKLASKKLDQMDDPAKPETKESTTPPPRPRLIRSEPPPTPNPPPAAAEPVEPVEPVEHAQAVEPDEHAQAVEPDPLAILAQFQRMTPKARAALFKQVGDNLDQETVGELAVLMQASESAAAADSEGTD